ncbi:MAG: DUF1016 N-terminal domain-containing protein [Halothiobacillus sp.]
MSQSETQTRSELIDQQLAQSGWNVKDPTQVVEEFDILTALPEGGQARAEYGAKLLLQLAQTLSHEFGRGFDERNLRNMRAFFLAFPNWNALRSELIWTHYRLLLRVDDARAREWYMPKRPARIGAPAPWSGRLVRFTMSGCWPVPTRPA